MEYQIVLNEQDLQNLRVFLQRTKLEGTEVPAFVHLMNKLQNVTPIDQTQMVQE
jgi:hypothetical protein